MLKIFLLLMFLVSDLYAWDYNIYTLFQHSTSNNYYESTQAVEEDAYNNITGTVQMSNRRNIIYAQLSVQKYSNITANDNYSTNLNWTYHQTKKHDYTFGIFKQVYLQTPTNVTDTSSSNMGAKIISSWNKNFSNTQSGYLSLGLTFTDYYENAARKDQSIDFSTGLQAYLSQYFTLTPSFSTNFLKSKEQYYNYFSIGPALYFSYYPNNKIVIYTSGSYLYTSYANRTFTLTSISGKDVTTSEKQTLVITEIGASYNLTKNIPLQIIYSNTKNTSNYSYRNYKLSTLSMSISANF